MTRGCAVFGCSAPVVYRARCARHARQVDEARSIGADRQAGAALYRSREWQRVRAAVLAAAPCCQCPACLAGPRREIPTVVHHIRPHGGDPRVFFDLRNLQALAKACHDRLTAGARGREGDQNFAMPTPPKPRGRVARAAGGSRLRAGAAKGATRG